MKYLLDHDKRIIPIEPQYNITNLLEQCYCYLSYFKIPHANLAMAECITLRLPVLAASTPEALEYSENGRLANLFPLNDYNAFVKQLRNIDNWHTLLSNELQNNSNKIKGLFDKSRNIQIFNNLLSQVI